MPRINISEFRTDEGSQDPFSPIKLRKLLLKNRFIKSATYEGMYRGGMPAGQLIDFHTRIALGGVGMTTVAYGAVNNAGRTHDEQMYLHEGVLEPLQQLTDSVHQYQCAASIQLTHCGYFSKNKQLAGKKTLAPSRRMNMYGFMEGMFFSKSMDAGEIIGTAEDFARAAVLAKSAGFDAVEIHMGHGYLISQFLSPIINSRTDDYGGTLQNRLRFPLMVLERIRNAVGGDFPVLCKMNLDDGFRGGLKIDESIQIAAALENAGADALILSGGYTSRTPFYLMRGDIPLTQMIRAESQMLQKIALAVFGRIIIRKYPFAENFFLPLAGKIREAVKMPVVYLGGVVSSEGINRIMNEGFDMIALGRALIHDPDFIKKIRGNRSFISPCNHCNLCVAEMDHSGVRCLIDEK
ncbi:MAG: NADH:flavin oxidoreductase [Cyclobacteriaceae bacterium]|nr:NADH:flavin oxidoreductase [Cyclobacteriaceae bacterium]